MCPCGYNLLTFDFVRLIVGYVATRDREEAAAVEEETECSVARRRAGKRGRRRGEASPSQTAGHFDVAPLWETRNLFVIYFDSF